MPTDVNVPRWRCDTCQTVYEGPEAEKAACHCEGSPNPEPLPAGTWICPQFPDLLNKNRWYRVESHVLLPDWPYFYADVAEEDKPPIFDLTDIQPPRMRASGRPHSNRGVVGHFVHYEARMETPRTYERREITHTNADSTHLWPHTPGRLQFGYDITKVYAGEGWDFRASESVGRVSDLGSPHNQRTHWEQAVTVDDAAAWGDLLARIAPGADQRTLRRNVAKPHRDERYVWPPLDDGPAHGFRMLRPNLDEDTMLALFEVCDDKTQWDGDVERRLRRALIRIRPTDTRYNPRWEPTPEEPHYGIDTTTRRAVYHPWLATLALYDHDGDRDAALRWLTFATAHDHDQRIEDEIGRFLDGEHDVLIPAVMFVPSSGMSRGPRLGRLRPEHKAVAKRLGVDWETTEAKDIVQAHTASVREALAARGVTMTESKGKAFEGAQIIAFASGKGGVGKTTVAAAYATRCAAAGQRVLLIDADVTGPSIGALYSLGEGLPVDESGDLAPVEVQPRLFVVSASQVLRPNEYVTWGEDTTRMFLRFISTSPNVTGANTPDVVIVDLPPGYTAQHRAVDAEIKPDKTVLVTTGSPLAHADLRRTHGRRDALGIIENLSILPDGTHLYPRHGTAELAASLDVDYLGSLHWSTDVAGLVDSEPFDGLDLLTIGAPA